MIAKQQTKTAGSDVQGVYDLTHGRWTADRNCINCGKPFQVVRQIMRDGTVMGGRDPSQLPLRCSDCRNSRFTWHTCVGCGKKWFGGSKRYCSVECRLLNGTRRVFPCKCNECGHDFMSTCREGKYCSPGCRRTASQKAAQARWSWRHEIRKCEICGIEFQPRAIKQRTCGLACGRQLSKSIGIDCAKQTDRLGHSKTRGNIGEVLFDLIAVANGWLVCRPVMDGMVDVDRVIKRADRWEGVQVKVVSLAGHGSGKCQLLRGGKARYDKHAFETLAMVSLQEAAVIMVPWSNIYLQASVAFSLNHVGAIRFDLNTATIAGCQPCQCSQDPTAGDGGPTGGYGDEGPSLPPTRTVVEVSEVFAVTNEH